MKMESDKRCYISIEEMKNLQVTMLGEIDAFCKVNNLQYFLFAGTLIGAVRHHGYIPWDDDLDICMKRKDYDFFFRNFNKNREDSYRAICFENDPEYYLASGKVIDDRTVLIENTQSDYQIGVYIDVFPMDKVPGDERQFKMMNRQIGLYRNMLLLKNVTIQKGRSVAKNTVLAISKVLLKAVPRLFILKQIRKIATRYEDNEDASRIADISVFTWGTRELFPAEDLYECINMEFEGNQWPVPKNYHHVLSSMYGEYMKLPPKEKQVSHHDYEVFWKDGTGRA